MKRFTFLTILAIGISGFAVGDQDKEAKHDKDGKIAGFKEKFERSKKKPSRTRDLEPRSVQHREEEEERINKTAPEIDAGTAVSAVALLSGALLVIRGHRNK